VITSPTCVAILPFAVANARSGEVAPVEFARGMASYLEGRLRMLPGAEVFIHHILYASNDEDENKDFLLREDMWSLDEALELPHPKHLQPTHVLQGKVWWGEDIAIEFEVYDANAAFTVFQEHLEVTREAFPHVFPQVLERLVRSLGYQRVPKEVVTCPTRSFPAFFAFLRGVSRVVACQLPVRRPEVRRVYVAFLEALDEDGDFIEAAAALDIVVREHLRQRPDAGDHALLALREAIKRVRRFPALRCTLGKALFDRGAYAESREHLESYLSVMKDGERISPAAVLCLAAIYHQDHQPLRAFQLLRDAAIRCPDDPDIQESLGVCHAESGNLREAEACWRRALDCEPTRSTSLSNLGLVYWHRGEMQKAEILLERSVDTPDTNPYAYARFLDYLHERGNTERADEVATNWVETSPENWRAWVRLAKIRRARGRTREAEYCLEQAEQLASPAEIENEIAVARFAIRFPDDYRIYQEALNPTPDYPVSPLLPSSPPEPEQDRDRLHDSIAILRQLALRRPEFPFLWGTLADRLIALEEFDAAVQAQEALVRAAPSSAVARNTLGFLLMRCGLREDAILSFRRAVALAPDAVKYRTNLAAALLEEGDVEGALEHLEAADALAPKDAITQSLLEEAWQAMRERSDRAGSLHAGKRLFRRIVALLKRRRAR
jgi:Flp pilus assembly protein TadD